MKNLSLFGLAALMLTGCASARAPLTGFWFTDVQSGENATGYQSGSKMGEACATSILGLIATGDASIEAARKAGGITYVISVDNNDYSVLGVFAKHCTIARGK